MIGSSVGLGRAHNPDQEWNRGDALNRIQERRVVLVDVVVPSAVPIGFGQPIVMRDRHL